MTAETGEKAELEVLRERAAQTGREAAQTLAELAARLTPMRDPKSVVSRLAARARRRVRAAVRSVPDNPAARRVAIAVVPVLGVLAVGMVAHRRGWLSSDSFIPR